MRTCEGSARLEKPPRRAVLTVGNFDGLHVGHQAIMQTVVQRARVRDGEAVVYTFEPHPRKVLRSERAPQLLTTLEQKLELLAGCGVDLVVVEPFDLAFAQLTPERFVREILHERLHPLEVYVGYDFRYGRDREGSMRTLTELGPHLGFAVTIIPEVTIGERDVNSSRIRELLGQGRVEDATPLLGRPYSVRGRVAEGDRRGRTLGFPTANLAPENEILPGRGVYVGRLRLLDVGEPEAGAEFGAVTNVGRRPTFKDSDPVLAEAHLLDFDGELYGRRVELSFLEQIRSERRFPDADALRRQIAADVEEARRRLQSP